MPFTTDHTHLIAAGYAYLGAYFGRAYYQLVVEGRKPDCLWPLSAVVVGQKVTVTFDVPIAPLVLDTEHLAKTQDFGFKVTDDDGDLTITSTQVIDGDRVEIYVDRALTTNPVVRYAMDYLGDGLNIIGAASGNLRDSTPETMQIGSAQYPLYHVCVAFQMAIEGLAGYFNLDARSTLSITDGANRIMNGDMRSDQVNAGASTTTTGKLTVDRWRVLMINPTTQTFESQQVTDGPRGFAKCIRFTVAGTGASPGATMLTAYTHTIEASDISDLNYGVDNAQIGTLSFWVKSSIAGMYGLCVKHPDGSRTLIRSYTIETTNTWEFKTITISGDTGGTWPIASEAGLEFVWDLGVGANASSTVDEWAGINKFGLTGGVKLVATTGAVLYLTGVKFEIGPVATPFVPDPFEVLLAKCQRYINALDFTAVGSYIAMGMAMGGADALAILTFPRMRAAPSVTLPNPGTASGQLTFLTADASIPGGVGTNTVDSINLSSCRIVGAGYSGLTAHAPAPLYSAGAAKIILDADL